jgi:GNAT superfamily N-acetyltransferase
VVLPASGWLMMAKVRRRSASRATSRACSAIASVIPRTLPAYHRRVSVKMATAADLAELELALATAFLDDPMVSWVYGEPDAERRHQAAATGFFRPSLSAGLRRGHTYVARSAEGRVVGGAVWSPPDVPILTDDEGTQFGMAVHGHAGDEGLGRLMALGAMVDERHPHDRPHFYLFILGATEQGRGIGAHLLDPVLARCDADGLPAYLESSSARNVPFYERAGFEVQWEERPAADGPVMRGMWREPR